MKWLIFTQGLTFLREWNWEEENHQAFYFSSELGQQSPSLREFHYDVALASFEQTTF